MYSGTASDDIITQSGVKLYQGSWSGTTVDGYGTCYYENGDPLYTGQWKDGRKHGEGTSYY